jgi:hypothetical protein
MKPSPFNPVQISNDLGNEFPRFTGSGVKSNRIYAAGDTDPETLGFKQPNMSEGERAAQSNDGQSNDANFDAGHLSEPLTQFVSRVSDEDGLEEELNALAPPVPVGRSFTYLKADPNQDFQKDDADNSDIREIGGDFKTLRFKGTQAPGRTDNKGLIIVLDHDQNGQDPAVTETLARAAEAENARLQGIIEEYPCECIPPHERGDMPDHEGSVCDGCIARSALSASEREEGTP